MESSTNSFSKDTGAIVVQNGGLGVEYDIYLGGSLKAGGDIATSGSATVAGSLAAVAVVASTGGVSSVADITTSSSGSVKVTGIGTPLHHAAHE